MKTSFAVTCLGVAVAARTAAATPEIARDEEPRDRRSELALGMLVGGTDVGDVTGPGVGLHVGVARWHGPVGLQLEYTYHTVGDGYMELQQRHGNLNRIGLTARYALWNVGDHLGRMRGRLWIEAGAGRHHVAWNQGGTLTRSDLALGFGFRQDIRIGDRPDARAIGWYTGLRGHVARAPDPGLPATCSGVCDTETAPSRRDLSLFWVFGINFGR